MNADVENWNNLAEAWDDKMGDTSNRWHRHLILNQTLNLLSINENDIILEIGCGNGSFANELTKKGIKVIATDFSAEMINHAKKRWKHNELIDFFVADATNENDLLKVVIGKNITKVVSNMAIMDISDIKQMFTVIGKHLNESGIFVFSSIHPCFQNPGMQKIIEYDDYNESPNIKRGIKIYSYKNETTQKTLILANNEMTAIHYHRPLSSIMNILSKSGFMLDAIEEPVFEYTNEEQFEWCEIPPVIIYRARKCLITAST